MSLIRRGRAGSQRRTVVCIESDGTPNGVCGGKTFKIIETESGPFMLLCDDCGEQYSLGEIFGAAVHDPR